MKKFLSVFLLIFCIFSFNTTFLVENVFAETEPAKQEQTEPSKQEQTAPAYNSAEDDALLDQPVFKNDKQLKNTKKITGKLSSIIIKLIGGVLLLIVVIICGSFIWIANLQRKKAKRKKRLSENANVINAVDNFARHRIK